jgi:hypothetical protein
MGEVKTTGVIHLEGDPPYDLVITTKETFHTECQSYRPDPREILKVGETYESMIIFEESIGPLGKTILTPKAIIVTLKKNRQVRLSKVR